MTHDLVFRGARLVDGTGADAMMADVGVTDGIVTDIEPAGKLTGTAAAKRVIDADERLLTPGFVDLHTHLDAQMAWDPRGTSSCWHGVTSVVMGNCGVTFAPVRPDGHEDLARMMESVEDIPAEAILGGLAWDWETYGGYLDSLDRLQFGLNVGGMVGHCAVRSYAMGDRSMDPGEDPSDTELELMVDLVAEAIDAGALGFSTSRTLRHTAPDGRNVPGTFASHDELVALAGALGDAGKGIVGSAPRFDGDGPAEPRVEEELAWMRRIAVETGRPVTFNLSHTAAQGEHYRLAIHRSKEATAAARAVNDGTGTGLVRPQTTARGIGVLFNLGAMTPFDSAEGWDRLSGTPASAKLSALRDPRERERLVTAAERDKPGTAGFERFFVLHPDRPARYDCDPEQSLSAEATRRGVSAAQAWVDLNLETDGKVVLSWPILNQDLAAVSEMLDDSHVVMGLADAGAHVGQILDASQPTFFLTYWIREQGLASIESAIHRITGDTAGFVGLKNRGIVAEGAHADLNLLDWEALSLPTPQFVHDFPGGAGRYTQRSSGYAFTAVNGIITLEAGEHTGALPGTVLRSQ